MDGGTASNEIRPHRFTVADYHRMAEAGILDEDSRVELIRGQIVDMAALGGPHINAVIRLTRLLGRAVGDDALVSVQNSVRLDDGSEPQPDIALLRPSVHDDGRVPRATDVLLLVEVSDSTLRYDRLTKAPLYAESGIPEYWIVDLTGGAVETYADPQGGEYRRVQTIPRDGVLTIAAFPGVTIPAADILPG